MRFGDLSDYDLWVIGLLWPSLTIIRFVLPKELANNLKAYRGKEVELYRRIKVRDHSSGKPGIGHLI